MVCPDCGTRLTDTDQFCPGCGAKIIRKRRCPECGETLREGVKFCPGCGSEVSRERQTKRETPSDTPKKKPNPAPPKKKTSAAPPPQRRQAPPKPGDWEDEEDDDYEDDEEESVDILSILTVAVGCILLVILAVLGYNLYRRYMPKDYDKIAKEQSAEQEEDGDGAQSEEFGGQELLEGPEEDAGPEEVQTGGTLVTTAAVNIRDNPSTDGTTVITKAKAGESYEYTEAVEGGTWYRILLPNEPDYEYGYVYADYVQVQ